MVIRRSGTDLGMVVPNRTAMRNALLPTTLLVSIMAASFDVNASRGTLKADGILSVKGAASTTAQVTIVPYGAPAYTLPVGTRHFELNLPLNDHYLASFSREGCPTKEVYFDASVPVEFTDGEFTFPFKVTLEHLSEERMFAYEAPVGYVRYMHQLRDFGYETQYLVKVKEDLRERMEAMKVTGIDPRTTLPPAALLVVDRPEDGPAVEKEANSPFDVLAANVNEVPRLVHRVGRETEAPMPAPASAPAAVEPVEERTPEAIAGPAAPMPLNTLPVDLPPIEEASPAPVSSITATPALTASTTGVRWSREEETITDPRMVIRIVRFTRNDGVVEEYRRVAHAYGAVFYFQEHTSITERDFMARTAMR